MANQKYDAFLTVARLGSFKAAAEELGYTQAGISYLVNALEKELGVKLISRSNRQLALTGAGELLLEEGAELLSAADRLEMKLKSMEEAGE